jgi:hypothetical protein
MKPTAPLHVYEVRPRKDKRGVDLVSDVLPFGRLWYDGSQAVANAVGYAQHFSRSHDAVIRVYDAAGNVIDTHLRWQSNRLSALVAIAIEETCANDSWTRNHNRLREINPHRRRKIVPLSAA